MITCPTTSPPASSASSPPTDLCPNCRRPLYSVAFYSSEGRFRRSSWCPVHGEFHKTDRATLLERDGTSRVR
jgi:hypothetical protein